MFCKPFHKGGDDPTTWLQPFIDELKELERYEEVVDQLVTAQDKVAAIQKKHIDPPEAPFLVLEHREALKRHQAYLGPVFDYLECIHWAFQANFIQSTGNQIRACCDGLGKFLVFDNSTPKSSSAERNRINREVLFRQAIWRLGRAKEKMDDFKTGHDLPGEMEWALHPGILKIADELHFGLTHKKEERMNEITTDLQRAYATQCAFNELVCVFEAIARVEKIVVKSISGSELRVEECDEELVALLALRDNLTNT